MSKTLKNKNPAKIIIGILIALCVSCVLIYCVLSAVFYSDWSSYEYYDSFGCSNGMYNVVLERSYPLIPPDTVLRFRIKCKETASGNVVKFAEFRFSVPKENVIDWFEFEEISSEKARLTVNSFHGKKTYEFNWNDIFST